MKNKYKSFTPLSLHLPLLLPAGLLKIEIVCEKKESENLRCGFMNY